MNKMKAPGILIKSLCMSPLNLSVTDAAKLLKISRQNLSLLINGKLHISPIMAIKLEAVFNTDARAWLELQLDYDLDKARKKRLSLTRVNNKKIKLSRNNI